MNDEFAYKIIEYILLNSSAIRTSGLYNGKAGVALTLFEGARYFHDSYLENEALIVLKETLINKNNVVEFENGLSGIGFMLSHLLKNKYIDGDFYDLFGSSHERIILGATALVKQCLSDDFIRRSISILYYLGSFREKDPNVDLIVCALLRKYKDILLREMDEISSVSLDLLLFDLVKYLFILDFLNLDIDEVILDRYISIYDNNYLKNDFYVGALLRKYINKSNKDHFLHIVESNIKYSILDINLNILSLKECVDYVYFSYKYQLNMDLSCVDNFLFSHHTLNDLQKRINDVFYPQSARLGISNGLCRYILLYFYKKNRICNNLILL